MNEQLIDLSQIPQNIRTNPQLLLAYIDNLQYNTDYKTPIESVMQPLDYNTTRQMVNIPQATPVVNSQSASDASQPAPSITLTPEQLEDTSSGAIDPTLYSNQEMLRRMANNRSTNTALNNYNQEGQAINPNLRTTTGNFQFFNPYVGTDLQSASFMLGQNIESGNTLGTVASGLKVATGLGRNFLSGLGYNRRNAQIQEQFRENLRDYLTGVNNPIQYEDGGEHQMQNDEQAILQDVYSALTQGASPEEVMQGLIQIGVDETTAQGMVEFVLQQINQQSEQEVPSDTPIMEDGGKYLDMMKGKRIKSYSLNPKTNNYEIEFD